MNVFMVDKSRSMPRRKSGLEGERLIGGEMINVVAAIKATLTMVSFTCMVLFVMWLAYTGYIVYIIVGLIVFCSLVTLFNIWLHLYDEFKK